MSYGNYVIAAYLVFVVVLAWDFVAPRIEVRQQLRAARARAARPRNPGGSGRTELPSQPPRPRE